MAYLVSHAGSKVHAANTFVVHDIASAKDMVFRLIHNGAVGVAYRELTADEYREELVKRLPPGFGNARR